MTFDRKACETLALEAARIFAEGLSGFVAAAAAEVTAEKLRLAEETLALAESRQALDKEWSQLRAVQPAMLVDAVQNSIAKSDEAHRLNAVAESEEWRVRSSALDKLRTELADGARDEALVVEDLARLRVRLESMEEERSNVRNSMFQCSCTLAELRSVASSEHTEASKSENECRLTATAPRPAMAAAMAPSALQAQQFVGNHNTDDIKASSQAGSASARSSPLREAHPGSHLAGLSRHREERRPAGGLSGSADVTPRSRRSSGQSTPKRLHLDDDDGRSSPGNVEMALSRARCELANAQQRHGRDSVEALRASGTLALAMEEAGQPLEEVGRLLRMVLAGFERLLGQDHLDTLRAANNVAVFLDNGGEAEEALALYRRASEGRRRHLGNDHPHALDSTYNLALFLENSGQLEEAEPLFREVLRGCVKTFGGEHHSSLDCMERLAEVLEQRCRSFNEDEAENSSAQTEAEAAAQECTRLRRQILAGRKSSLGLDHPETLQAHVQLAEALSAEPGVTAAELCRVYREAIREHERVLDVGDRATIELTMDLAAGLASRGDLPQAEEVLRTAREVAERELGMNSLAALGYDDELAVVLATAGRLHEAEPLFRRALNSRRKALGPWHEDTLRSEHNLAVLLDNAGHSEEAGRAYREVQRGRLEVLGEDHPKTVEATYNLAIFLAGRGGGCSSEAVRLLQAAQHGLERHGTGQDDPRLETCKERLEELNSQSSLFES